MSALPFNDPEAWVPKAVIETAAQLHAELSAENHSIDGLEILSRLIFHPGMKAVWTELYRRKRIKYESTEEFLHPARVTNRWSAAEHRRQAAELRRRGGEANESEASLLEAEADVEEDLDVSTINQRWSEQDRGAQLFLRQACISAIEINPIYLTELQDNATKLLQIATNLRQHSGVLLSLGLEAEARSLKMVAFGCDRNARDLIVDLATDDPWVISRNRGDLKLRTYIVDLSISTKSIFGTPHYGTLATVASVVFGSEITADKVRELLR
jgi:hypothetical protein